MKKKEEIRKEFLVKRNKLTTEDVCSKSMVISKRLFSLREFIEAEVVMLNRNTCREKRSIIFRRISVMKRR